jgi:LmbE family N-acetylglucosaminyl deacetylase
MTSRPPGPALPRRVLAVGAHPDDIELSCAGTLGQFLQAGSEVMLAVVTRGDRGGPADSADDLAATRRREAERSAAMLGAQVEFLGFGDGEVRDTPEGRRPLIDVLRRVRPDLVITHGPTDYHADHVAVCRLMEAASWFSASTGHVSVGNESPLDRPPALVYMENLAGVGFEPTHLVDITTTMELKRRMLACHVSQLARGDTGMSVLEEMAETLARLRGIQCGVRFAEGFRPALLWGRRTAEPIFP